MLSANHYPTLYMSVPALEHLQAEWEALQDKYDETDDDGQIRNVLQAGLDKLTTYYLKMESTDAYGIAMHKLFDFLTPYHSFNQSLQS